jgi:hypothetical protein
MIRGITKRTLASAAIVLGLTACDTDVSSREGEDEGYIPNMEANGVLLNSFRLNSFRLNSFRLNSFRLNGDQGTEDFIEIVDIDVPGKAAVEHSWIDGSELNIVTTADKVLSGSELEGTTITFHVQEDGVSHVREVLIADVDEPGTKDGWGGWDAWNKWDHDKDAAEDGLVRYDLRLRELPDDDWEPLCGLDDQGQPIDAVLLTDIWDPETGDKIVPRPSDAVTFACVDAALGKCATWGYHPWASVDGEPLADYHQACTRLVRADYCGDGVSYTDEGTPIHVLDLLGIELLDTLVSFLVEAEWGPDGAVCLNLANTRIEGVEVACGDALPACGDDFASGGLLQSGKITGGID